MKNSPCREDKGEALSTPSPGCCSPWTQHPPTCTICLVTKVSDLLAKDKSVSVAGRQACLPAALLTHWEDGTCYGDQLSDADMKSEGSAGRSGAGFGRRQQYGFDARGASPDTADTQSVSATCNSLPHLHFSSRGQPSSPPHHSLSSDCAALPGAGQSHNSGRDSVRVQLWTLSRASCPTSQLSPIWHFAGATVSTEADEFTPGKAKGL